ncbi:MAG: hypothetical protein ACK4ZJ_17620, partial [Allorhizobium sp.]
MVCAQPGRRRRRCCCCCCCCCSLGKAKVDLHSIFEEVPVEITNPLLVQALVFQLQSKETDKTRFDCLDLGTSSFLERNVELLMEWVEDTTEQQSKFHNYERAVARQQEEQQRWLARRVCCATPPCRLA